MLFMLLIGWLPWLVLGCVAAYLGLRLVRAIARRGPASTELTELRERVKLLEDAFAQQSEEVRRVTEGQQFTQALLAERTTRE
jgi:hypothetical protein